MERGFLNLAEVRPWWLRLCLLLLLGSPMLSSGVVHGEIHLDHVFRDLGYWSAYLVLILVFTILCVGLQRTVDWLAIGGVLGLVVVLTGGAMRSLGFWEAIGKALGTDSIGSPEQETAHLVLRLFVLMPGYPLSLLVLGSFSPNDIVRWISREGSSRATGWAMAFAVALRMIQHVAEIITVTLVAWREENPALILPRFRDDLRGAPWRLLGLGDFARSAVWVWCLSITVQSLVVIPSVVRDFSRGRQMEGQT